jgi:hypothetical protein
MQCAYNLHYMASSAIPHFTTLSHKRYDIRKKIIEHKMCVLTFSEILSEIFRILSIIKRDFIINIRMFERKVPLLLSNHYKT